MKPTVDIPTLTIDGPSGAGKGSVGLKIATALNWHFLDSGSLYRVLAYAAEQQNISLTDAPVLADLARTLPVSFASGEGELVEVHYRGQPVGDAIRTEAMGEHASLVAAIPEVRQVLLERQRQFRQPPGLVADGRDMGTRVFPQALVKIFLTASPQIRAQRRYKQLKDKGFDVNLRRLLQEIRERDARDAGRRTSPLKPAVDAIILDSSNLSISEVVARVLHIIGERVPV
jgi:CMP/dCMP kinase